MNNNMKEVYFNQYCSKCKYASKKENEEPCDECLGEGARSETHKPLRFEEKVGKKK